MKTENWYSSSAVPVFVWLLQICHGVEIFSAPADLQMQMGVLRALNIGGISRCSQLLSALDGIALPHFQRTVQPAVPAGYAVVVVDGDGVAPQRIVADTGHRADVDGVYIRTGFTGKIHTVVRLPCTGGLRFYQLAGAERCQHRVFRQGCSQVMRRRFCLRLCFRGIGERLGFRLRFCLRLCCCGRDGLCFLGDVGFDADDRRLNLIRDGSRGQFCNFREGIQIFLQRAAGLPVRKETGCADHGKADAKRRVESAESCGAVFCLVFHTNHLRPYSAPPVNIYTHPLQISGK